MDLIKWDTSYQTGIEEIDKQHRRLFKLLNDFILSFGEENTKEQLRKIIEEMINYMDYHFTCEERYLRQHPDFDQHHRQHADFVKKTLQLQKDFHEKGPETAQHILKFLILWLKNHILTMDIEHLCNYKNSFRGTHLM